MAELLLIPSPIGNKPISEQLPKHTVDRLKEIQYFIVENIRTTRRFLKKCHHNLDINPLTFYVIEKNTSEQDLSAFLKPLQEGHDMALISDAGAPCVADPGANLVCMAQQRSLKVVPCVGPSSLIMALMASGLNGQQFTFHGYLPVSAFERKEALQQLERLSRRDGSAHLFIETPYRNNILVKTLLQVLHESVKLCIATELASHAEQVKTKNIAEWKTELIDLHKKPTLFIIQAPRSKPKPSFKPNDTSKNKVHRNSFSKKKNRR